MKDNSYERQVWGRFWIGPSILMIYQKLPTGFSNVSLLYPLSSVCPVLPLAEQMVTWTSNLPPKAALVWPNNFLNLLKLFVWFSTLPRRTKRFIVWLGRLLGIPRTVGDEICFFTCTDAEKQPIPTESQTVAFFLWERVTDSYTTCSPWVWLPSNVTTTPSPGVLPPNPET